MLVNLGSQYKVVSYRNCIIFFGLLIPYNSSLSQFISLSWAQPCFSTWYGSHDIHHECSFLVFFVSKLSINHFFSFILSWIMSSMRFCIFLHMILLISCWIYVSNQKCQVHTVLQEILYFQSPKPCWGGF